MTPDYLAAAASLFSAFTFDRLVPLLSLSGLFGLFFFVLFSAQRRDDFDASEFLRDDKGKLSSWRLFAFVCCSAHTWAFTVRVISEKIEFEEIVLYAVTWSGSAAVLYALSVWRGTAPPKDPS